MKRAARIIARVRRNDGQVLPFVAFLMVVLVGFCAIVIDVGRVYVAQQELQTAVNAGALAAGQQLPNAQNAYTAAISYGGAAGEKNALNSYGATTIGAPQVTLECASHAPDYTAGSPPSCPSDTSNTNCQPSGAQPVQPSGATTCNAIRVTETATVKTTLGSLLFPQGFTISASTTAAARGGQVHPLNVEVILDNTQSMTQSCSATVTGISNPEKIDCAKAGVRALLL